MSEGVERLGEQNEGLYEAVRIISGERDRLRREVDALKAGAILILNDRDAAESLIRRLDWSNIHTHYGVTSTCADCHLYAMLTQAQSRATPFSTGDAER